MIRSGKRSVLGIQVDMIDYDGAVQSILQGARNHEPLSVSALAVHGLMLGVFDREQRYRLNSLNLLVPDGQPIRWALNWLHGSGLTDRVYGPNLTLAVCRRAEEEQLPVYFYGATPEILALLTKNLLRMFPRLILAGTRSSKFRKLTSEEKEEIVADIRGTGTSIVFVGLGCPRQEVWAYEFRDALCCPVIAVGAALPFIAGTIAQAPTWMQDRGLEWLFRLRTEPRRLWRRYLLLNPAFLALLLLQAIGVIRFSNAGKMPAQELLYG